MFPTFYDEKITISVNTVAIGGGFTVDKNFDME